MPFLSYIFLDDHRTDCDIQVNSDGLISFGATISNEHTPRPLPVSTPSTPFIAPYWADVDTTKNNGRIYYRTVTAGKCHTTICNYSISIRSKQNTLTCHV